MKGSESLRFADESGVVRSCFVETMRLVFWQMAVEVVEKRPEENEEGQRGCCSSVASRTTNVKP